MTKRVIPLLSVCALAVGLVACSDQMPTTTEPAAAAVDVTMLNGAPTAVSMPDIQASVIGSMTGGDVLVFGDYPTRNNAASMLAALGYSVTNVLTPPADLSPYVAVYHVGAFAALTPAQSANLASYLGSGGGVFLTGERPCCETMNASVAALVNSVVVGGGVTVGNQGDPGGPYLFNSAAVAGIATTPNSLSSWMANAPGGMTGVSGDNILVSAPGAKVVAAAWESADLAGGRGRLVVMMDVNWWSNGAAAAPILQNIQAFLEADAIVDATPPSITANVVGTLGNNGWYTSDVAVSWIVTDDDSPISSQTGCTASSVTANTAGVTFTCSATSAGGNASESVTIKRDATVPVVTYAGNAGTYAVDANVAITCAATDDLSGVAGSTCADVNGAAYTFALGNNSFSATATDNAGNEGSGSTNFTVTVSAASLCNLTKQFVSHNGIANSLCAKLNAAAASADRGNTNAKQNQLGAYINEVQAQAGKAVSAANATTLTALANALM